MTTTATDDRATYEGWVVLEILGHRRLVGHLSEVQIAGAGFLRIRVPNTNSDTGWAAEQLYSPGAVYAITPTTEATARRLARTTTNDADVTPFRLPEPRVRWSCTTEGCYGSIPVPDADTETRCPWCATRYRVERTEIGVLFTKVEPDDATDEQEALSSAR